MVYAQKFLFSFSVCLMFVAVRIFSTKHLMLKSPIVCALCFKIVCVCVCMRAQTLMQTHNFYLCIRCTIMRNIRVNGFSVIVRSAKKTRWSSNGNQLLADCTYVSQAHRILTCIQRKSWSWVALIRRSLSIWTVWDTRILYNPPWNTHSTEEWKKMRRKKNGLFIAWTCIQRSFARWLDADRFYPVVCVRVCVRFHLVVRFPNKMHFIWHTTASNIHTRLTVFEAFFALAHGRIKRRKWE